MKEILEKSGKFVSQKSGNHGYTCSVVVRRTKLRTDPSVYFTIENGPFGMTHDLGVRSNIRMIGFTIYNVLSETFEITLPDYVVNGD